MRFSYNLGLDCPDPAYPLEQLYDDELEQARLCEDVGFDVISTPEHHFMDTNICSNPILLAQRVADHTRHVRICTCVLALPFWDVRRLAGDMTLATHLTKGRIEFGLGRGAYGYEFRRFQVDPASSREKFDETLDCLQRLFAEKDVAWNGKYYQFPSLTIMPRPYQGRMPVLWVAALSPVAIYHCARRGLNVQSVPLSDNHRELVEQCEAFKRGVAEWQGSGEKPRLSQMKNIFVVEDDAQKRRIRSNYRLFLERFNNLFFIHSEEIHGGVIKPIPLDVTAGRDDDTMVTVPYIGTANEVADKLAAFRDLGVDELSINMNFFSNDQKQILSSIERFGSHVMPQLRAV